MIAIPKIVHKNLRNAFKKVRGMKRRKLQKVITKSFEAASAIVRVGPKPSRFSYGHKS